MVLRRKRENARDQKGGKESTGEGPLSEEKQGASLFFPRRSHRGGPGGKKRGKKTHFTPNPENRSDQKEEEGKKKGQAITGKNSTRDPVALEGPAQQYPHIALIRPLRKGRAVGKGGEAYGNGGKGGMEEKNPSERG